MRCPSQPIGVMDSGAGGLTVAACIHRLLPHEDIAYFGDSANCPYGNRSGDEIFSLSCRMIDRLLEKNVKCVAIACNTISTISGRLCLAYPGLKIISIVEAASGRIGKLSLPSVGLYATNFTVASGMYEKLIHEINPGCSVYAAGASNLAGMIEHGASGKEIEAEIKDGVSRILAQDSTDSLILGCTHFPIVSEVFHRLYPRLNLIDPAVYQAEAVRDYLGENGLLNISGGSVEIESSGSSEALESVFNTLK